MKRLTIGRAFDITQIKILTMSKFLVRFNDTYKDIDILGFKLMSDIDVNHLQDLADSINWSFSFRIPNGKLEFSSGENLLSKMEFNEISDIEYKALKKIFGPQYGVFIDQDFLDKVLQDDYGFDDLESNYIDYDSDEYSYDDYGDDEISDDYENDYFD
jgi:hypothetical protein